MKSKKLKLALIVFVFFYTASHLKGSWNDMNWIGGLIVAGLVWVMLFLISSSSKKSLSSKKTSCNNPSPQKGRWATYCPACRNHFFRMNIVWPVCPHCGARYDLLGENQSLNAEERKKEESQLTSVWICKCNKVQRDLSYNSKCKRCGYIRPDWGAQS